MGDKGYYYYLWRSKCWLKGFICFWKGHSVQTGGLEIYECDWCDRCFMDEPDDAVTFPALWENFLEWIHMTFVR